MYYLRSLRTIETSSGYVQKYLDSGQDEYLQFGEVYFSVMKNSNPRPLKKHSTMTMNLTAILGSVEFSFLNKDGSFEIVTLNADDPELLTVPPGTAFTFVKVSESDAIICNLSDIVHDENEVIRK